MSTLRPGQTSKAVKKLRSAAMKELEATPEGESRVKSLTFDTDHSKTPPPRDIDHDSDNGVANFPGVVSEHIGNGTGGVR